MQLPKLCFGTLTLGPLQSNLSIEQGSTLIKKAINSGIKFIDTAQCYGTYEHIKAANLPPDILIASKSFEETYEGMKHTVQEAINIMGRVDIFLLHGVDSPLKNYQEAWNYLKEAKIKGLLKLIGISTHSIKYTKLASDIPELDIIHPLINKDGIGIKDGTKEEMLEAIKYAKSKNKLIYIMKPLGGGNLLQETEVSLKYLLKIKEIDSIAIGIQDEHELAMNNLIFQNKEVSKDLKIAALKIKRKVNVKSWCTACGKCIEACKSDAISIKDNKAVVDETKCVICGYCGRTCPSLAIRIN